MTNKGEFLEDINTRDFYDFYKKIRKKPSKKINQYNYFNKAISGMLTELKKMVEETEHGVYLKDIGVLYKKPYGEQYRKKTLFTSKRVPRNKITLFLEDEYLRSKYIISYNLRTNSDGVLREEKPESVILHRKFIKK